MKNSVSHQGLIESIEGCHVRVRFTQHAACASCQIAGHCTASEAKVKVVDVYEADTSALHVGDTVTVATETGMATRALLLGFGVPLLIMMLTLVCMKSLGISDGVVALSMLALLVPYYFILWLCRKHIAKAITFRIEQENKQN